MTQSSIRKIYFGVADRRQMFRLFDRHAQRPNRVEGDDSALFRGEWFEIGKAEHDYMFEILPSLWMKGTVLSLARTVSMMMSAVPSGWMVRPMVLRAARKMR